MILFILIGNIGTGKTTFAKKYENVKRKRISFDELEKDNKHKLITEHLNSGQSVILDGIFLTKKQRFDYIFSAKTFHHSIIAVDFGKGDEISLKNRTAASPDKSAEDWEKIYKKRQLLYEPPSLVEGFTRIITIGKTVK